MINPAGAKIRAARVRLGLTQGEAARKMGVTRQQLAKWESDHGNPTLATLDTIARMLGISFVITFGDVVP